MTAVNCFPINLAEAIHSELELRGPDSPALEILTDLFETLYFVSLKTEELQPITCYIVYLSPENPDPKPPERIVKDRWSYIRFVEPIPFTTPNLVKLAKASDPRTSSFAVYHDTHGHLSVWGIIDQANGYHDFVNYDKDEGPERPGMFQASIIGIGHLVTHIGYEKVAELKTNILLGKTLDVLSGGPIYDTLISGIQKYIEKVRSEIPEHVYEDFWNRDASLASYWISSLCRLLLRARNYWHGGAVLITPDTSLQGLNVKYGIQYHHLRSALEGRAIAMIQETYASDLIIEGYLDQDAEEIPTDLYLEEAINRNDLDESLSELDGAIWFISLLTRVDGLVLMNPSLEVQGFGVEITYNNALPEIFLAGNERATKSRLQKVDYNHFGTRHRSMMRYCSQVPGSIGFVISQDGDVRAITLVRKQLVMWENIRLQRDFKRRTRRRKHARGS
jgi:sensor domain DACNV-containing protein